MKMKCQVTSESKSKSRGESASNRKKQKRKQKQNVHDMSGNETNVKTDLLQSIGRKVRKALENVLKVHTKIKSWTVSTVNGGRTARSGKNNTLEKEVWSDLPSGIRAARRLVRVAMERVLDGMIAARWNRKFTKMGVQLNGMRTGRSKQ